MKKIITTFGIALAALVSNSNAQVTLDNIDVRGTGVFGAGADDIAMGTYGAHGTNAPTATNVTINGVAVPGGARTPADPIEMQITYDNLDLDFDATANDSVTFTLRFEKVDFDGDGLDGGDLASFGQGFDTGFGNLNDLQLTVTGVTGTTTDSGSTIYFDGFTQANLGAGGNAGGIDRTAEVNGTTVTFNEPDQGGFFFVASGVDFATPVQTVTFDNSGDSDADGNGDGGVGSIVARSFDMQFSLTPPTTTVTLGDFDDDGDVDCDDLDGYVGNIGAAATGALEALDFDSNGTIDASDATSVITTLVVAGGVTGTFPGDLNCDGTVDVLGDAFPLVANLNSAVTTYAQGDVNFSGAVDVLGDAFILVANLGNTNQ